MTAIAAVNGRGSRARKKASGAGRSSGYARRYAHAQKLLGGSRAPNAGAKTMKIKGRRVALRTTAAARRPNKELHGAAKAAAERKRARLAAETAPDMSFKGFGGFDDMSKIAKAEAAKKQRLAALAKARKARSAKREIKREKRLARKYKPLTVEVAGKPRKTYLYRSSKGKTRHIPTWRIVGASSARVVRERPIADPRIAKRVAKVEKLRERRAEQVRREGDMFTPNTRTRTIRYEEWAMKPNRKKARKASKGKKLTKAQRRAIALRNLAKARRVRSGKAKAKAPKKKAAKRAAPKLKVARKRSGKRAAPKVARKRSGKKPKKPSASVKKLQAGAKRWRKSLKGKVRLTGYIMNRRHRRRNPETATTAVANKGKRSFKRNVGGEFFQKFVSVLKPGAVMLVGFVAHTALTKLASDNLLSKVPGLKDGESLGKYRNLLGGIATALLGVSIAATIAPKHAVLVGAGMVASLLHKGVSTLVGSDPKLAGYLGEYYPTDGLGAYWDQPGSAMGYYQQAAAGFGAPQLPMQAAAGVGEFVAPTGIQAFGEYEQVPYAGGMGAVEQDGIYPDVESAERALDVAEAAAGIGGFGDIPAAQTFMPSMATQPVGDGSTGARAGVFDGGGGGIFG